MSTLPAAAPPDLEGALCAQADPDAWFPEKGDSAYRARAICRRCPVQLACLRHALANDERYGVWGGLTPGERAELRAFQRDATPDLIREETASCNV